jgi:hypothetical protein
MTWFKARRRDRSLAMGSHPCDGLNRSRYAAARGRRHREIARTDEIGAGNNHQPNRNSDLSAAAPEYESGLATRIAT